jgi:hypothetical protein
MERCNAMNGTNSRHMEKGIAHIFALGCGISETLISHYPESRFLTYKSSTGQKVKGYQVDILVCYPQEVMVASG